MSAKPKAGPTIDPLDVMPFCTMTDHGRRFWRSDLAHPDYSVACTLGEGFFASMKRNAALCGMRPEVLLQRILVDMVKEGRVSGVEVGFLSALADDWAKS